MALKPLSAWDKGTAEAELATWLRKWTLTSAELSQADAITLAKEITEGRKTVGEVVLKNLAHNPTDETMKQVWLFAKDQYIK